jgi:hypothetical protein
MLDLQKQIKFAGNNNPSAELGGWLWNEEKLLCQRINRALTLLEKEALKYNLL